MISNDVITAETWGEVPSNTVLTHVTSRYDNRQHATINMTREYTTTASTGEHLLSHARTDPASPTYRHFPLYRGEASQWWCSWVLQFKLPRVTLQYCTCPMLLFSSDMAASWASCHRLYYYCTYYATARTEKTDFYWHSELQILKFSRFETVRFASVQWKMSIRGSLNCITSASTSCSHTVNQILIFPISSFVFCRLQKHCHC